MRFGSLAAALALLVGAATFNLFYSFLAGCLLFAALYGFARWSTQHDPQMLAILLRSGVARRRYDAAQRRPVRFTLRSTPWFAFVGF